MNDIEKEIDYLFRKSKKPKTLEQILEEVNVSKDELLEILDKKINNYEIIDTNSGYIRIDKTSYRKGRLIATSRSGNVYIDNFYIDRNGEEVYYEEVYDIAKEDFNGAIDGDMVLIDIINRDNKTARVDEVIDRNLNTVMGEVYKEGNTYYLDPVDPHKKRLTISFGEDDDFVEGERVIVDLDELIGNDFYLATLNRRLGHKDDPDLDVITEAYRNGFEIDFSNEAIKQLDNIPNKVSDIDKIGRSDLTDKEIFTIDGDDTKDIDDAVSLKILDNGNFELGVHIADPAYYIKEDSALDQDARSRSTSVYAADTVIPMLPHKLSNGICSLNPGVERLTQSCVMEIDHSGNVVNYNIFRSVIKSNIQMTYKNANRVLEEGKIPDGYLDHVNTLNNMKVLAKILSDKEKNSGCIDLDVPDLKVKVNEEGKVTKITARNRGTAENIIEEFMIVANETICKHLVSNFLPSINRVHEEPSIDKINDFLRLLRITGNPYNVGNMEVTDPMVLQSISEFIDKLESNAMLKLQFLKSLKRARYSSVELGHSGLGKDYYCHFTSPMRRYPDLIQNRILNDFIYNNPTEEEKKELLSKWRHKLPGVAEHSSHKEKHADFCEGDVFKMKCCEYMSKFVGKKFEGVILDMDANTIFVRLDNMVEGRVRPRNFGGDYYYSDKLKAFISKSNGDNYCLGDRLELKLIETNKEKKLIDFKITKKLSKNVKLEKECSKEKVKRRKMYYNSNRGVRR